MKVSVRKEINISSATIANELVKDGAVLDYLCQYITDILHNEYEVDWDSAEDAVGDLCNEELIEIIELMAKRMREDL